MLVFILAFVGLLSSDSAQAQIDSIYVASQDSTRTDVGMVAQIPPLTLDDFQVGQFRLDMDFDSVHAVLHEPLSTRPYFLDSNYVGYHYPHLVAWINEIGNRLVGLEITDSLASTSRGLRVGDSVGRIQKLYGKPVWHGKDFDFVGAYTYPPRDYSDASLYKLHDYQLAVFVKGKMVRKIIMYRETWLDSDDFDLGILKLGAPFPPLLEKVGKPDSIRMFGPEPEFTGFYFPRFILWRDDAEQSLSAVDVYDSSYVTYRGLRVGDSISRLLDLYGNCTDRMKTFGRVGPFDSKFADYQQAIVLGGDPYLVFFIKDQRVVKILSYMGVGC